MFKNENQINSDLDESYLLNASFRDAFNTAYSEYSEVSKDRFSEIEIEHNRSHTLDLRKLTEGIDFELRNFQWPRLSSILPGGFDEIDVQAHVGYQLSAGERVAGASKEEIEHEEMVQSKDLLENDTTVIVNTTKRDNGQHLDAAQKAALQQLKDPVNVPNFTDTVESLSAPQGDFANNIKGTFENSKIWDVLQLICKSKYSGTLTVSRDDVERKIFFEDGFPLTVHSDNRADRLVELLYKEGRITSEQYETSSLVIGNTGRRAGVVLVEKGILSTRELFPMIRYHYEYLIMDCFNWETGHWEFVVESNQINERILLDREVPFLIIEGFISKVNFSIVEQLISPNSIPTFNKQLPVIIVESLGLTTEQNEFQQFTNGRRNVEQIAIRSELPVYELQKILAGLLVVELVSVNDNFDEKRKENAPQKIKSEIESSIDTNDLINKKMSQIAESSYYEILEINIESPLSSIEKAYKSMKVHFTCDNMSNEFSAENNENLKVINIVLDEAFDILSNIKYKKKYDDALFKRQENNES